MNRKEYFSLNRDFELFRKDRRISGVALHDYKNIINSQYNNNYINPSIIEERQLNVTQLDVFSRLMIDKILFLGTPIDDTVSNILVAQLLFLQSVDSSSTINLYQNSPGGSIDSGLAILDCMNFIKNPVNTLVCGMSASMSFVITVCGEKRSALKHSRLMCHQPMTGIPNGTQCSDIIINTNEIIKMRDELYRIISEKTKQPFEKISQDSDRDKWFSAEEARDYGAIDEVIGI